MATYDLPVALCPHCGRVCDAATDFGNSPDAPKPGDISICFWCATPLRFDDDLRLRLLTDEERGQMGPTVRTIMKALKWYRDRNPAEPEESRGAS